MESDTEKNLPVLRRLASVLGVPVERFFTDEPPPETGASAEECLRLWSRITTDEERLHALEALRIIAEMEQT